MTGWTDDRVAVLKRLWGQGHSASAIAADPQIADGHGWPSRSAVLGQVHRLGLSNRQPNPRPKTPKRQSRRVASVPTPALRADPPPAGEGVAAAGARLPTAAAPVRSRPHCKRPESCMARGFSHCAPCHKAGIRDGLIEETGLGEIGDVFAAGARETVRLVDHRGGQCRWPLEGPDGETFSCATRRAPGSVYCAEHHALAYRRPDRTPETGAARADAQHAAKRAGGLSR